MKLVFTESLQNGLQYNSFTTEMDYHPWITCHINSILAFNQAYVFSEEAVAKIAKKHIGKTLVFQHTIHCCLVFVAFDQEKEVLYCDCLH